MTRDDLQWHIAARPSDIAKLPEGRAKMKVQKAEYRKARVIQPFLTNQPSNCSAGERGSS